MIIVAKSKIKDAITGKKRAYKYSDIPTDINKWVYDLEYMPIPYDLMFLRLKENPKVKSGWWDGAIWQGLRLKDDETIIAWKRNYTIE